MLLCQYRSIRDANSLSRVIAWRYVERAGAGVIQGLSPVARNWLCPALFGIREFVKGIVKVYGAFNRSLPCLRNKIVFGYLVTDLPLAAFGRAAVDLVGKVMGAFRQFPNSS
jgi:hypothetical protein